MKVKAREIVMRRIEIVKKTVTMIARIGKKKRNGKKKEIKTEIEKRIKREIDRGRRTEIGKSAKIKIKIESVNVRIKKNLATRKMNVASRN